MNRTSRRKFIASASAASALAMLPPRARGQGIEAKLAVDPERPQFHLLPAKNWMNDPNGPIYFNGMYHMFFQYNPHAAVWGDMSWNHAISPDMIHWTHLPLAFTPTLDSPDSFGCFSGSAIAVGKRVYAVYTGTRESTPELATIRDGSDKIQESQCLAWSDDPRLIRWEKDPKPVVARPPEGLKITGFRDPSAWKQGERYYMTVGSGIARVGGCVLLYRSKDLKQWEYLHELTSGEWNGTKTANPCDDGEMWECPEFFPLDGGHVLIYSTLGKVFWESGALDEQAMTFHSKKKGELDLGAFYAPKTQLDAHGQRILWGWIPEKRSEAAMREAGWSGMMSLPRVLRLDADGTLRIQALPQLATLRDGKLPQSKSGTGAQRTIPAATGEFIVYGNGGADFNLNIFADGKTLLTVGYSSHNHSFMVDDKEIAIQSTDDPKVHGYVDGSVIELILGERIGYTRRFYYPQATAPDIEVHAAGKGSPTVEAWKIEPISSNRLTTPAATI